MQVLFQYMPGVEVGLPKFDGMAAAPAENVALAESKFDLAFHFSSGGAFAIEYKAELFDRTTIERLAGNLEMLLGSALAAPDAPAAALSLLGSTELALVLAMSQGEVRDYTSLPLVHQAFEATAAAQPSKSCLEFEGNSLTYSEVGRARSLTIPAAKCHPSMFFPHA